MRKQLTFICNRELNLYIREREPISLIQSSSLADSFKEGRYVDIVNLTFRNNDRGRSRSNSASRSRSPMRRDQSPSPIYDENLIKVFFSGTVGPISRKFKLSV